MKLKSMIAVYATSDYENSTYVEKILFSDNGKMVSIKPVTDDDLKGIRNVKDIAEDKNIYFLSGPIPSNLVYISNYKKLLVWKVPERKVKVNSKMKDWKGELLFPQMLMILENDNLKAYGLHEDMLYDLMIPHYGKGHVCTGYSNDFLEVTEVMKAVEYAFYHFRYSSWTHSDIDDDEKVKICNLYKKTKKWGKREFNKLEETNSLSQLLSSII